MPTIMRVDGYRLFFFSDDHPPPHVHIEKGDGYVRIEIISLEVTNRYQLSSKEVNKLIRLVKQHQQFLIGAWNEFFRQSS